MQSDLKAILYEAETNYLPAPQLEQFKANMASLAQRLETYQLLRDREIEIFQPIALELDQTYARENPELIEKALKHWIAVMRYGAMAMLLNNPEYLHNGILDWLGQIVKVRQIQPLENSIYELLLARLEKTLSSQQFGLMQPFLEQIKASLIAEKIATVVGG